MVDLQRMKTILEQRRAYLHGKIHEYEDMLDAPAPKDVEDRATEREDDEVLEHLGLAGQDEIRHIDAALVRVADGSYGVCANCGDAIPQARLDALPFAVTCITCAGGL